MTDLLQNAAIIASAALAFVLFWLFVVWLISRMSGWGALAERYPARRPWNETCWRLQSARFRLSSNYSGILTVCADAEGMHVSVNVFFRIGHPAFSVPWAEVEGIERQLFLFREVELRFQRAPALPMRISPQLARRLAEASNGAWTYTR